MTLRWSDFITPSTLQLAPLLELLLEPVPCRQLQAELQLGLQEALVNAVRHGNGGDPGKLLRIRRIETPCWMVWQVQDEGSGVPPHSRQAALLPCPEAVGGRGLFLIQHCFDDVRWSPRGNRLQLAVRKPRRLAAVINGRGWGSRGR
ncbi:ATP-binding protein [Cyanobium sp. ATX 6A2]|jgi:serine/threonine-protein kinase RsbW/non-specific serine/threonine protein kinase|uniref:ATP-binding protein n=1 Tax=Cyanobium sp. ATX 6A2 TaxID=2823700 RepID=UPI0020CC20F9|nr:ATP-binding protein [Cyanobium sp. ATX 6A2]MCP9887122.1 ATP-binding protein [Cyanobium sp. ATX 6A2]